jgi:hypothetical protein
MVVFVGVDVIVHYLTVSDSLHLLILVLWGVYLEVFHSNMPAKDLVAYPHLL